MKIELINTGSELLLGQVLNTHQQWICRELFKNGYEVQRQVAISDSGEDIMGAVREAMERATIIIVTGGLGPTSDDRTRDMIAEMLGLKLTLHHATLEALEKFFASRKRPMPESTKVQAMVPEGSIVLPNPHGTAPGLVVPAASGVLIMLPGPPRELRPMFRDSVLPYLKDRFPTQAPMACQTFKTTGIGESFLEERVAGPLQPLVERGLEIGYCARVGEVDLRLITRGTDCQKLMEEAAQIAGKELNSFIYGMEPEQLDSVIVRLLTERNKTLALAESCTGGYIANRLTNIPGASKVFMAGLVTYSNEAKQTFLGVSSASLEKHGAVSEEIAREMAAGALVKTGADYALSITGIAGPGGGSTEKPVGTVFISLANSRSVLVKRQLNQYDRETFKYLTSQQALEMLRRSLLHLDA